MQKIFLGIVVIVVLLAAGFFSLNSYIYNEKQASEDAVTQEEDEATYSTFTDREIGISFEYTTAPDGYVIDDMSHAVGVGPDGATPLRVYSIISKREKAELEASAEGREGPPTMQLAVYENTNNQSASVWVDAFPMSSYMNLVMGEVARDATVGGADAVRYFSDGLYVSENVVVAKGDFIYHFSGGFLERESVIHTDFQTLMDSVSFLPTGGILTTPARPAAPAAKIDVRVACESALAYTLFQSSESADAFMAECVAGEHPDVIERYIESLGLPGATI